MPTQWPILPVIFAGWLATPSAPIAAEAPRKVEFNRDIRPILSDKCFFCHGPDANHREADLRFDVEEVAKADRDGRRAIVAGQPEASELVRRITSGDESERMPPQESGKELAAEQIELLLRWIDQGAEYQPHWSYIPPRRPPVPAATGATASATQGRSRENDPPSRRSSGTSDEWPVNAIDGFILACLEAEGLTPAPEADPVTLVRRLYFDLTGLPPPRAEVDAFVHDDQPQAYERLVDRLLESPHYGERMAMYWLDLVRYANTVGYHGDQEHAISPYRDWVIKAFNDNLPFDQFTVEQLAGDLLPDATVDQQIASGYNRLLQTSHEGGVQVKEYLSKYDADRVRNLGGVWMGATTGCVQCHDHKFDPYTQRDFYSLAAFFADIDELRTFKGGDTSPTKREPELEVLSPLVREEIARLEAQLNALDPASGGREPAEPAPGRTPGSDPDAPSVRVTSPEEIAALRARIEGLRGRKQRTMITKSVEPRTIRVLARGDWMDESGDVVEPAVPQFLGAMDTGGRRATRLDLARWLTSKEHPQTARVFVNRLWYVFFGGGLSKSLDDNGAQGEWPTHPELLDWLAVEFREGAEGREQGAEDGAWDVKHMVKLLVMSRTYRQSSLETPELRERDTENRLFARQGRWRLPAEMIRDNALAVSGLLVDRLGGGVSRPYQPAGYYQHLNFPKRDYKADADENQYRRGVYVHWQRIFLHPMLKAFDATSREECTAQRPISNTPLAALVLLNDPTFVESARVFAVRVMREGGETRDERIRWAWREAVSREASEGEVASLAKLYAESLGEYRNDPAAAEKVLSVGLAVRDGVADVAELAAWTSVARAVFNVSEFIGRN
jgi:cytochrome c553